MTTPTSHVKPEVGPARRGVTTTITHFHREANDEAQQLPLDFGLIRRLLTYTRPYVGKRNWLFLLAALRSLQLLMLSWMIGQVIEPITKHDLPGTVRWAVAFLVLALTTQISFHFRMRLALELGEAVMQDLRRDIFQHLLRMPMSFFNRTKLGRMISRITSDADAVRVGVQDVLFVSLVQGGQMIFAGLAVLYYDWLMFLVLLAMAPALWILNRHFRRKLSNANRAVQESFSRITSTLAESVNGIRVTQGFARQELNASFFRELVTDHSKYNLGVARASGVFLPLLELHGQLFTAVLLGLAGWQVITHRLPLGDVIKLGFLANLFLSPIPILGNLYNQALTAMAGAERVFKLLDEPPDWQDDAAAQPLAQVQGRVEFRHVAFCYVPDRFALQDVSFVVAPGMTVALVGQTSSGKTTVANLIAKFYLPTTGQ
ncbi:MAG: ABC transporter ATP-binding protein, partial [Verrucomicrobiota bacterium]